MRSTALVCALVFGLASITSLHGQYDLHRRVDTLERAYRTYRFDYALSVADSLRNDPNWTDLSLEDRIRTYVFRGEALYEIGREAASDSSFRAAWLLLKDWPDDRAYFPNAYRVPQALIQLDTISNVVWRDTLDLILERSVPNHPEVEAAKAYHRGMRHARKWEYRYAAIELRQSLKHLDEVAYPGLDRYYNNHALSEVYSIVNDHPSALVCQQLALQYCPRSNPREYFRTLVNVAGYQLDLREMEQARQTLAEARTFAERAGIDDDERWAYYYALRYDLHNVELSLDSMQIALDRHADFYTRFPQHRNTTIHSRYLNQRAGLHIRRREYELAAPYLYRVLGREDKHYYTARFLLTKVICSREEFQRAVADIHDLIRIYHVGGYPRGIPYGPDHVFRVDSLVPDPTLIEYVKDKASYYSYWNRRIPDPERLRLSRAHVALADSLLAIRRAKGRYRNSSRPLDELSAELRKVDMTNIVAAVGMNRADDKTEPATSLGKILTENEELVMAAFNAAEKVKQLAISERLHEEVLRNDFGLPAWVIERERKYFGELSRLLDQNKTATDAERKKLSGQIDEIREAQAKHAELMRTEYNGFYELLFTPPPLGLEQIRERVIGPNEVLLQFLQQNDDLYVVAISQQRSDLIQLRTSEPLRNSVESLHAGMRDRAKTVYPQLYRLYSELLAPLSATIGDCDLVIIPDGYLWHLPFAALLTAAPRPGTLHADQPYLIKDRNLRYLLSGRTGYLSASGPESRGRGILAVAPLAKDSLPGFSPLPASARTLRSLRELRDGYHDHYLVSHKATTRAFRKLAPGAALLHVGTHARIDDRKPEASYLVFNSRNRGRHTEPATLSASDIYGIRLAAQLGVLSACNTADGRLYRGQGLANLARAFTYAGCHNLVVNLWEVKDRAAADLMDLFYPAVLTEAQATAPAFCAAQRAYLAQAGANAHPGFWSGGIYLGRPVVLPPERSDSPAPYFILAVVAILLCSLLLVRVQRRAKLQ